MQSRRSTPFVVTAAFLVCAVALDNRSPPLERDGREARRYREACEHRFLVTDFAVDGFKSPWMNSENMSAYIACLYQLRTRLRPSKKSIFAAGVHYPTLLVANHQSPPVSTSGAQWCWLDDRGIDKSGLTHEFCCDPKFGDGGRASCWDDHFNYDLCCRGGVHRGELPHYFVAPAFDINVGSAVRQLGTFDLGQSYALQTLCGVGDTVIDVGANVGGFTVPLAERVGPGGEVHAFEPFRKIYQHLNANVALNGLSNVYTHNCALGTEAKEVEIHAPDLGSWNFPSAIRVEQQISFDDAPTQANLRYEAKKETVAVRQLDSFQFGGRVRLIKIDVEFMELQVVLGARKVISKHQPIMWVENEPFFDDPPDRTFVDTMSAEFGYQCQSVARLELLCTPPGQEIPNGFKRVLRHLSGQASEVSLWRALSEVDSSFDASGRATRDSSGTAA